MMLVDFHVHSYYSHDSALSPFQITKKCKVVGIDCVALLDNNLKPVNFVKRKMECIPGCEVKTEYGEIICLFIEEPIKTHVFEEIVDLAKENDLILGAPHPFDIFRRSSLGKNISLISKHLHFIEVYNSRCLSNSFNLKALMFSKINKKSATGGSDSHSIKELGNCMCDIDVSTVEDIRKVLKKGISPKIYYKKSPFYVHFKTFLRKRFSNFGFITNRTV